MSDMAIQSVELLICLTHETEKTGIFLEHIQDVLLDDVNIVLVTVVCKRITRNMCPIDVAERA